VVPLDAAILLCLLVAAPLAAALVLATFLFRALARRRGWIPADLRSWIDRPAAPASSAAALLLFAGAAAYGAAVERERVETTRTEIRAGRAVLGHERFRIAHLSDLHLERLGRRERRAIEAVRAARPHLILLTGDCMNVREAGGELRAFLELLKAEAPLGVFGVPGHRDLKFPVGDIFARAGVRLLEDDTHLLTGPGRPLRLVGQSFHPGKPLRDLLEGLGDDAFTIYLYHSPDGADELALRDPDARVDLFLCGHTHGGQICLPFWGAILTFSRHHKKYERGLYRVGDVPMYVNRGLGTEGVPVRFLARPEVAILDLVAD
jgi:predicted MPP superfamily phosphohydrolase